VTPERFDGPRVVITGMGWITPLGHDVPGVWSKLIAGESAIGPITHFPADTFPTNFAAEVKGFDLARFIDDLDAHAGAHRNSRYALAAAAQAWRQAGLGDVSKQSERFAGCGGLDRRRLGIYLGAGEGILDFDNFVKANLSAWDADARTIDDKQWATAALELLDSECELEQEPHMPVAHLANEFGAMGPAYNTLTACAASTQATGEATEILRRGDADIMIAGGTHTMIHPLGVTGFVRLTALSASREDPKRASRPFDATRNGFVMGEGAGIVILERLEHAVKRGATPLAEIVGYGSSADAYRITDIQPEGLGAVASMREALDEAGLDPLMVDEEGRPAVHYISAHGTGTKENDSIESRAVKAVFGEVSPRVPISSIKSMMGHLIAAAGAVELITCVQAIRTGVLPPTMNLEHPDPECDLDYVPNKARVVRRGGIGADAPEGSESGVEVAMSNSFGFGGQNDTIIIRRFDA